MARIVDNSNCKLYHTRYCDMLNMPSCGECAFSGKQEECDRVMEDLDVLEGLLPEGGITALFEAKECQLCKGPNKKKRSCYAMVDMAHIEPVRTKRNAIGMKTRTNVGSLLPVQAACCDDCRKRLRLVEYLPVVLPVAVGFLALLLVSLDVVNGPLKRISMALPLLVFAVVVVMAMLAGRLIAKGIVKRNAPNMTFDMMELDTLRKMTEKGWFPLNAKKRGRVSPVFLNKRLKAGVGTGTLADAVAFDAPAPPETPKTV